MPALNSKVVGVIELGGACISCLTTRKNPDVDSPRFSCDTVTRGTRLNPAPAGVEGRFNSAASRPHFEHILADVQQLSDDLKQEWSAFLKTYPTSS